MKALLIATVLISATVFAAENKEKPTTAPQKAKVAHKPVWETNFYKKRYGGVLIQPGTMKGCIALFDGAGFDKETEIVVRSIRSMYHINAKLVKPIKPVTMETADREIAAAGATVGVFVVDNADYPALLSAPESKWTFVNVAKLKADSPDPEKLAWRVRKEIWRAFAYTCGGGASSLAGCVMNPIYSLADLDALQNAMISPEGLSGMNLSFKKLGITPFRRVSYRDACREGWAPAPTNEFQKAIWDKIHQLPTNPLEIKFDPKRDAKK